MARYHFAGCELDPATRSLQREGRQVAVEPKVFDLLLYMIEQRGRFLSREELLDAVWQDTVVAPAALSRAIREARRAVGDDGERQAVIATLHGRGYRFVAEVAEPAPAAPIAPPSARPQDARPRDATTEHRDYSAQGEPKAAAIAWMSPAFAGSAVLPGRGALVFGRGDDCDFVLSSNDLSRRHAEVRADGPIFVLRDLGSTNGTFLNGERIEQAPLTYGDVVRLGDIIGIVTAVFPGDPAEPRELAPGLVGSPLLERVLRPLRSVARDRLPVVLVGETGTGKELIARAIHGWSGRSGAFVAVHCAALSAANAAEALFGGQGHDGLLARAHGGTLLLDHVALLPAAVQALLLPMLERGEVLSAGDGRARPIDLRVIASSQEPLAAAVDEDRLRADLHAQLAGVVAVIPPLRNRSEDVPALFSHFARSHGSGRSAAASPGLLERLCLYDWPYNLREFETLVRRLLLEHGHEPMLRSSHLPSHVDRPARMRSEPGRAGEPTAIMRRLRDALRAHGGNVAKASSVTGLSLKEAYAAMERDDDVES